MSDNFYVSGTEWFFFLYFKYWHFRSWKRFWDWDFFVNVLELHHSMEQRKMIWRFTLVFMKSYAGNWQINRYGRNWRKQMTAILDNRSWNPRVYIGPAVILPDLPDNISFSLGHVRRSDRPSESLILYTAEITVQNIKIRPRLEN
jgi:hypothetical protein